MTPVRHLTIAAVLLCGLRAESLTDVLARMDRAAQEFRTFSANVKRTEFTAVLSETTEVTGTVRLRRGKGGTEGIMEFQGQDPYLVHFGGRTVEVFYPKANTVQIYDTGKRAGAVEQFLLLGFGTSGAAIRKDYEVKLGGSEPLAGLQTTRIELAPKAAEMKNILTKVELWIPEGQANPVQEKVTTPSRNYTLIVYSDPRLNGAAPDAEFVLKLPANVKKVYPQK
jgi:outer membrane lipoprotein-sorting protein